jgi:hypothetical protein
VYGVSLCCLIPAIAARSSPVCKSVTIQEFIATVRPEIEDADFETKQRIITMLNVEATLTVEEGKKFVYARCVVSQDTAFDCDEYNVFQSMGNSDCSQKEDTR